jgi:hypothetical protein
MERFGVINNVKVRYYSYSELRAMYNKLTCKEKIVILTEALDYMQQANWRSKSDCILLAMGYKNYEGELNTYFKAL